MFRFRKKGRSPSVLQKIVSDMPFLKDPNAELTTDLIQNEQTLRGIFQNCFDVIFRTVRVEGHVPLLLVYVDGLFDSRHLDEVFLKPLILEGMAQRSSKPDETGKMIEDQTIAVGKTKIVNQVSDIVKHVLSGDAAILAQDDNRVLIASGKGWDKRSIDEPASEPIIRGPREGFIENLQTNISLLRRRLRTPRLKMELCTIGELSQTDVVISYIEGVAMESVVEEVRRRVGRIKIDGILDTGYIEEFIEDAPFSPFPQILNTERPDVVAGQLLEGRVAIFADGSPFVLIVPMTFWSSLHSGEDYYERALIGTAIRWLRFIFLFIALFFPSLYVAVTTFHQEMIPSSLLFTIAAAREATPLPALIEALLMEVTFEALREAGIRLPKPVGQAISIVGVLVIGESAVSAGIVSAPMVIIVSLTGIASFTIPRYSFGISIRMLRFPIILLAGAFGLYGIVLGIMAILFHITGLRSFGVPYFAPIAPLMPGDLKDLLIRAPLWKMNLRPQSIGSKHPQRVPEGQKPGPKQKND